MLSNNTLKLSYIIFFNIKKIKWIKFTFYEKL